MPTSSLAIHLFGPMQVLVDGNPIPPGRTRAVEWLLALLALRHGHAVDRRWLAGVFWPESEEARGLHNLRTTLVHLRKALGSQAGSLQSPTRDTLTLDLSGAEVDVVLFDRGIKAGDEESLRRAVNVYAGPLMQDCYEEWVLAERELRAVQCLAALEKLADREEEQGRGGEAIRYLLRAEAMDPLRESVVRRLMGCLMEGGEVAAAGETYRRFRVKLDREMRAVPDQATTLLYQRIRARARENSRMETSRAVVSPSLLSPRDQAAPASSADSSPAFTRPPHPLTSLIGRETDLQTVQTMLAQHRLVTLMGAGGVGKTRLATEVAGNVEGDLARAAVWVELAPLREGGLILPAVAAALALGHEGIDAKPLLGRVVDRLSEERCLLVMDNCEHLVEDAAQLIHQFLASCPQLRVLATSRQRLGLTGELAWRVPSLPCPPETSSVNTGAAPGSLADSPLDYPAVRLFMERALSLRPGFRLTGVEDVEAVGRICRRLDGIPLALELAAARANVLSVTRIASGLDQRFRLLTGGSRAVAPRHQTLQALIDWSYDDLSEPEQILLRRLSVFVGGWSLEAAEGVCGSAGTRAGGYEAAHTDSDVNLTLDILASLEGKSLVLVEEAAEGLRYRMLETVREYAREKLRLSGEEQDVQERHAHYFLSVAERAHEILRHSVRDYLDCLESDHDNLRQAISCLAAQDATVEMAVRMAAAMASFWNTRGHFYESRTWLVGLAKRQTAATEARAHLLSHAGWIAAHVAEYEAARQMFQERLEIWEQLGNRWGVADTQIGLAGFLSDSRFIGPHYDPALARTLAEESLATMRELRHQQGIGQCCYFLGRLAREAGDLEAARALWTECRRIDMELGVRGGHVVPMMGELALETGDLAAARDHFQQSLRECRETGNPMGMAWTLRGLASVARAEGEPERAARLVGAAAALQDSVGGPGPAESLRTYTTQRSALRELLDESVLNELWNAGRTMTADQAAAYALDPASPA